MTTGGHYITMLLFEFTMATGGHYITMLLADCIHDLFALQFLCAMVSIQRRLDTYAAHVIVRWTQSDSARVIACTTLYTCMFYIPTSTASFPCQYGLGPRVNEPT